MDPSSLATLVAAWDKFVVTLDEHRIGALIFLVIVVVICHTLRRRQRS